VSSLDKLGNLLMTRCRDRAIQCHDLLASGGSPTPSLAEIQKALATMTPDQKANVRRLVMQCIDVGIFDLLVALQEAQDFDEGIALIVDGEDVAEKSGTLFHELVGEDGWVSRFSEHDST